MVTSLYDYDPDAYNAAVLCEKKSILEDVKSFDRSKKEVYRLDE